MGGGGGVGSFGRVTEKRPTRRSCQSHNEDHFENRASRFPRVDNGGGRFKRTIEFLNKLPGYKVALTSSQPQRRT